MTAATPSQPPRLAPTYSGNATGIKVGAYRWDAWWHQTSTATRQAVEATLGPSQYHWRAPSYAVVTGANSLSISGQQADMDADIGHAVDAGIDYWVYDWYGATDPMQQAWVFHQASTRKNDINWCINWIDYSYLISDANSNASTIAGYAAQSNYQTVLNGRPLFYIFDENGDDQTGVASAVTAIRTACTGAGLPNPYFALVQGNPNLGRLTSIGVDAVTKYALSQVINQQPLSMLTAYVKNYWNAKLLPVGKDVIPSVMLGHDRRPRIENPPFWQSGVVDQMTNFYYTDRISDIGVAIDECLKFVRNNASECPANTIVIYGWNEHDEGGWIAPTLFSGTERVQEVARVLK